MITERDIEIITYPNAKEQIVTCFICKKLNIQIPCISINSVEELEDMTETAIQCFNNIANFNNKTHTS